MESYLFTLIFKTHILLELLKRHYNITYICFTNSVPRSQAQPFDSLQSVAWKIACESSLVQQCQLLANQTDIRQYVTLIDTKLQGALCYKGSISTQACPPINQYTVDNRFTQFIHVSINTINVNMDIGRFITTINRLSNFILNYVYCIYNRRKSRETFNLAEGCFCKLNNVISG